MKFMNMKRFASIAMAGALALSLAAPAFASGATPAADPNTTKVEGAFKDIEINVVVPESGTAQINPYGLPVSISKADMTTADIVDQKITSLPMSIRNQGTVDLDVNASLLAIPKGDVAIAAAKDTGKTIAVTLEVAGLNSADYAVSTMDTTLEDKLVDAFVDDDTWTGAGTLAAPAVAKGATTGTATKSQTALAVLGAAVDEMGMVTYGNDSIAVFRLTGDVAEEPQKTDGGNTVDDPWKETDGFTATIVFKFKPHQAAPATHNITEGTHVDASSAISAVAFKVGGTATTSAAKDATVTIEVTATAGKTITAKVNGGSAISLTEATGTYTGTFTMPDADAEVILTVS